jgi:sphingolipid delta-4 desaturase
MWLLFYPIFQGLRPLRLKEISFFDGWIFLNWLVQFSFDIAIYILFGPQAFFYLLISLFFSVGLHPLGARWIQRHYLVDGEQETYSYYGSLNRLSFNVGYHNEHHDFPSVPWNHLPKVKTTASEFYDSLTSHQSWTKLLFQFLSDRKLSLFSRIIRSDRGQVALNAEVKPDIDSIKEAESVHA